MTRILLLIAIVAVVVWLFRALGRKSDQSNQAKTITDDMVICAHCGVHVPKKESVVVDGAIYFCCVAHRDAYRS